MRRQTSKKDICINTDDQRTLLQEKHTLVMRGLVWPFVSSTNKPLATYNGVLLLYPSCLIASSYIDFITSKPPSLSTNPRSSKSFSIRRCSPLNAIPPFCCILLSTRTAGSCTPDENIAASMTSLRTQKDSHCLYDQDVIIGCNAYMMRARCLICERECCIFKMFSTSTTQQGPCRRKDMMADFLTY